MSHYDTNENEQIYDLIMDPEFFYLSPLPSEKTYSITEEQIVYNGCPAPIPVWNNIILYDYMHYEICKKWGIPFSIKKMSFTCRNEAILYTALQLLKTKDLPVLYYRYLIGKMYHAIKPVLPDLYDRALPFTLPPIGKVKELDSNGTPSAIVVGLMTNVSHRTVAKYSRYSAAIDRIMEKCASVAKDILHGNLSLSVENTVILSTMSANEIQVLCNHAKVKNNSRLLHLEIQKNAEQKKQKKLPPEPSKYNPPARHHRKSGQDPAIKQMPKYDPDAELSSLSLTIPTWISSMKRASSNTDFSLVSNEAMLRLQERLHDLMKAGRIIEKTIKENTNARE